jgi:hypothetical protein
MNFNRILISVGTHPRGTLQKLPARVGVRELRELRELLES